MSGWKELAQNPEEWDSLRYDDPRLDEFAHAVEDRYGLPRGLVEAIKNAGERTPAKSSGKPTVSPVGAKGVMQFMDKTRKEFDHDVNDPFQSIDAAGRYMAKMLRDYPEVQGNPLAALGWYNGGKPAAVAINNKRPPPAKETRDYIARIQEYMDKKYGGKE